MKFSDLAKPKVQLVLWGCATALWVLLLIPSLLIWKDSILWVIIMSWWANVSASAAAFLAAHGEKHAREAEKK